jgi:hypothetical protein
MSNYIKIPLANNPARSFVTGALDGTATGGGTVAGSGASAAQPLIGGSGSGATATVAKGSDATIANATITIDGIGAGYKVGDVVTIAILSSGGATTWTAEISYTILAADLAASSGSATEPFFLMPIDNVGAVVKGSSTTCIVELKQANATGTGPNKVAKYTITVDDVPATTALALQADVAAAVIKAASAENAQPEVKFTSGAECLTVVLS